MVTSTLLQKGERGQKHITQLLLDGSEGNHAAVERVTPFFYGELNRLAHHYMNRERAATRYRPPSWSCVSSIKEMLSGKPRAFFAIAAQMMRRMVEAAICMQSAVHAPSCIARSSAIDIE